MTDNEIKCGLWEKTNNKGTHYFCGKIFIDGKGYFVNLFENTKKFSERSPDFNIIMNPSENYASQSKPQQELNFGDNQDLPF
jgi:hypothetical protein